MTIRAYVTKEDKLIYDQPDTGGVENAIFMAGAAIGAAGPGKYALKITRGAARNTPLRHAAVIHHPSGYIELIGGI